MAEFKPMLRPELACLIPYNSGLTLAEVAARPGVKRVAKLGSNENPAPIDPEVATAIATAISQISQYPDPLGRELLKRLAQRHHLKEDKFVLGNGSEDLLSILARTVLRPGDRVVTLYPSFPLHEDYARMMGAEVVRIGLTPEGQIDVEALLSAVSEPVRLVLFANPMNPAGLWLQPEDLQRVLAAVHPDAITCIDEAYHEYAEGDGYTSAENLLCTHHGPLLVLRTFSKAWGLAALRIGYGMTNSTKLAGGLHLTRTPFNVNSLAQVAALAVLEQSDTMERAVSLARSERVRVQSGLERLGLRVLPSRGNFLFFELSQNAADIANALLDLGTIIKPWKQPGYEYWARVSIGAIEDNDQFLTALAAVLGGK